MIYEVICQIQLKGCCIISPVHSTRMPALLAEGLFLLNHRKYQGGYGQKQRDEGKHQKVQRGGAEAREL